MTPLMPQLVCQAICNCGRAQLCASSPQHISTASHTHTAHQHSWHLSTVQPLSSAHIAGSQHISTSELEKAGRISPLPQSSGEWKPGEFVKMNSSYFTETCARGEPPHSSAAQLPLGESLKNFVVSVRNSYITLSIASSSDAELCLISFSLSYLHSLVAAW